MVQGSRIKGAGENPHPARVLVFWVGRRRRKDCGTLSTGPLVGCLAVGCYRQGAVLGLWASEVRDNRFSVSGIPDTAGHVG